MAEKRDVLRLVAVGVWQDYEHGVLYSGKIFAIWQTRYRLPIELNTHVLRILITKFEFHQYHQRTKLPIIR